MSIGTADGIICRDLSNGGISSKFGRYSLDIFKMPTVSCIEVGFAINMYRLAPIASRLINVVGFCGRICHLHGSHLWFQMVRILFLRVTSKECSHEVGACIVIWKFISTKLSGWFNNKKQTWLEKVSMGEFQGQNHCWPKVTNSVDEQDENGTLCKV